MFYSNLPISARTCSLRGEERRRGLDAHLSVNIRQAGGELVRIGKRHVTASRTLARARAAVLRHELGRMCSVGRAHAPPRAGASQGTLAAVEATW